MFYNTLGQFLSMSKCFLIHISYSLKWASSWFLIIMLYTLKIHWNWGQFDVKAQIPQLRVIPCLAWSWTPSQMFFAHKHLLNIKYLHQTVMWEFWHRAEYLCYDGWGWFPSLELHYAGSRQQFIWPRSKREKVNLLHTQKQQTLSTVS